MSDNEANERPKRQKNVKKNERNEILDQLKRAKRSGTNYKQEIEVENIYDIVDEATYERIKEKRQLDNFIDGPSDYIDDGKELFDSDDEDIQTDTLKRKKSRRNVNLSKAKVAKHETTKTQKCIYEMKSSSKMPKKGDDKNLCIDDLLCQLKSSEPIEIKNPFLSNKKDERKFDINQRKISASPSVILKTNKTTNNVMQIPPKPCNLTVNSKSKLSPIKNNDIKVKIDEPALQSTVNNNIEDMDFDDIDFNESMEEPTQSMGFSAQTKVQEIKSLWKDEEMENENVIDTISETYENVGNTAAKQIYWFDAYHDKKIPGVVFLFGKMYDDSVKTFVNACIRVHGLERRIFVLPKTECEMTDVYNEIKALLGKHNIENLRTKPVTRKYAFQYTDVPDECEYLLVQYDSKYDELPHGLTGKTFSRIFGTNTSCLETFIMDLKLKGPSWLSLNGLELTTNQFSTCKLNFDIKGIKGISIVKEKAPPFTVLSLNIQTVVNKKTNMNEIVAVGAFIHNEVYFDRPPPSKVFQHYFTILTHPKEFVMPYDLQQKLSSEWDKNYKDSVTIESNERSLINNLLVKLQRIDPDLIVGHSLFGYQLEILLQRCQALNINTWHKMGRLRRNIVLPKITGKNSSWLERMATAGRMICDIAVSSRELIKCRSYEQYDLIKEILPEKFQGVQTRISIGDISNLYLNSAGIKQLIDITLDESLTNIHLMHELQILPLALEITSICGNLISRTLSSGKSERNEYLLLHAFNEKEYIVPDKFQAQVEKNVPSENFESNDTDAKYSKRKPTYSGGLVLEPKRGLYESFILLMDFNSLYPSIIREFNICFTTIDRHKYLQMDADIDKTNPEYIAQEMGILMELSNKAALKPAGILPTEIRKLVESRKAVKNLLNNPKLTKEKKMQYDIRQKALKITANSMYGCLGFSQSRFQATQLASLVTSHGRNILLNTKQLVGDGLISLSKNKLALDIIYGDTDSVMVNTGITNINEYDQVMKIGQRIKEEVNKLYKEIQLDIDGVLRRILLLNKKKYAALTVVSREQATGKLITKQELKGLDIVRRDWCKLSVEVGKKVVTMILEGEMSPEDLTESIHNYIKSVSDDVRNDKIDLQQFVITKALTRNPENYSNTQGQPHVQVALRLNSAGTVKQFRAKDTVEYVICIDGTSENATHRAYSPQEVLDSSTNKEKKLCIDSNYYLAHQLHPVVTRLIECIDGISAATVAEHLGLDSSKYHQHNVLDRIDNNDDHVEVADGVDKFIDCKPIPLICRKCEHKSTVDYKMESGRIWTCSKCNTELLSTINDAVHMSKRMTILIKQLIHVYYASVFVCLELECRYICRELPNVCNIKNEKSLTKSGQFICPKCGHGIMKPILSHSQLYNQLAFYKFLFTGKENLSHKYNDLLQIIRDNVDSYLKCSSYLYVDFQQLLGPLLRSKKNCQNH